MSNIAIYGGSFNPIHSGHLIVAEEIRQLFRLDKVVFVPAARPPHKSPHEVIAAGHRASMVQRAIEGNPYFELSDIEIKREGVSYTIDTLRAFYRQLGDSGRIYFIIGSDAFLELNTWKEPHELFDLACFVVIERPGAVLSEVVNFLQGFHPAPYQIITDPAQSCIPLNSQGKKVFLTRAVLANISSSGVRELVRRGKSPRYLVPDRVMAYIEAHQLYIRGD